MDDNFENAYDFGDYGKLIYECDDSLGEYETSQLKRKALIKSPRLYFFIAVILIMVSWFIASLISNAIKHGFLVSIGMHITGFFALFVMSLIIILSIGGFWGKMVRWNADRKKSNLKEFINREDQRDEFLNSGKNVLRIYKDRIVIIEKRESIVFDTNDIKKVRISYAANQEKEGYNAIFFTDKGKFKISRALLPLGKKTLIQFKKIFREKLEIDSSVKNARSKKPLRSYIAPLLFVSLGILFGIVTIVLHFALDKSIPIFLGGFFIICSFVGICCILDFISALKDIALPLLVSVLFLSFPYMTLYTIYNANGIALTAKVFFEVFNPIGAAVIFFGSLGLTFIFDAIKTAIDYVRYGDL
ncbi:MAG: hypothetical protein K2J89_03270 [Clostridia bacterium]|nr:hypothetical protein [Clostridia bacterium]